MSKDTKIKATKIKMMNGKDKSSNLEEIDSIYLEGAVKSECFYPKDKIYDALKKGMEIAVNIYPYPLLIPVLSTNNEKYVRSTKNNTEEDNLLKLPRE